MTGQIQRLAPTAFRGVSLNSLARGAAAWLLSFVPVVGPLPLAGLRIFLGLSIIYFVGLVDPISLSEVAVKGPKYALNSATFIKALSASADARALVYWGIIGSAALFALGVFSRLAGIFLTLFLWLFALMSNLGHFMTPLLLAMTTCMPARWGDRLSVDHLIGLHSRPYVRSRLYGYPIYMCGLSIALAYTAAGLSKIVLTNGAWIWETGARWGFIADLHNSTTELGLLLVNSVPLAIAASFFAAIGQIGYLASCFTRDYRIKLALGALVALPFLFGLIALMGLFWWPWVILVVVLYAPWHLLDRLSSSATKQVSSSHDRWAAAAIALLLAGHAIVVVVRAELEPLISNYPMYAMRFPSNSDYERANWKQLAVYNRHYRHRIEIGNADKLTDVSAPFAWSVFLGRALNIRTQILDLSPGPVWAAQAEMKQLDTRTCEALHLGAGALVTKPTEIRFGQRFFDLSDTGTFAFSDPKQVIVVDLVAPGCPYSVRDSQ